ncbi:MAG: hypothetical protein EON58_22420 [Alphaproteobacteria bacterium]|nr:MAG: hypothetical protein EON58_22420 [Alphaproteobacteria bacterium]
MIEWHNQAPSNGPTERGIRLAAHQKARERGIEFNIDLWAVERDRENYQSLEHSFAASGLKAGFPGRIHLRHSSYEVALREALEKMATVSSGEWIREMPCSLSCQSLSCQKQSLMLSMASLSYSTWPEPMRI